jgi:hypothetical protein
MYEGNLFTAYQRREKISSRIQQYSKEPCSVSHSAYLQNLKQKAFRKASLKEQRLTKMQQWTNHPTTKKREKNRLEVITEELNSDATLKNQVYEANS